MNLLDLKPSERVIEILSPKNQEPIGIRITLVHVDDPRLKKLKRQIQDESSRLSQRGKIFKAEQLESNIQEVVFTAMTGWEWYNPTGQKGDAGYDATRTLELDGDKNPPFTKANVLKVFEVLPWFLEQIKKELDNSEAFFPG